MYLTIQEGVKGRQESLDAGEEIEVKYTMGMSIFVSIVGLAGIVLGGDLTVNAAKEIARENAVLEHSQKVSKLAVGETVSGKIVRMESYGVFIEIGEDLIGLCHISQITNKFIKSPKEVVKPGDTVSAKIIALDGDRISLSMKALEDDVPDAKEDTYEIPDEFRADKEDDTDESPFAKLLKGIKL